MARTASLRNPVKKTINIENDLHAEAVRKAKAMGFRGGFSEYVTGLLKDDLRRKGSNAAKWSRGKRRAA